MPLIRLAHTLGEALLCKLGARLKDLRNLGGEVVASAGRMNPQIRFGEDLMSRVSYAMMNPGGAAQMTAVASDIHSDSANASRRPAPVTPAYRSGERSSCIAALIA